MMQGKAACWVTDVNDPPLASTMCDTVRFSLFDEGSGNIFTLAAVAESEAALFLL